jgi:Helix-turn-helix domain
VSLRATIWGWDQLGTSSTQKLVLLDLCDRAGKQNTCWPKQRTIANRVRLTERAVHSALAALEEKGLIKRQPRTRNGKRTSDMITVLIDGPPPSSIASEITPVPPPRDRGGPGLPTETGSCDHLNDLQVSAGMTFSVTCKEEPPRLNRVVPRFLEMMPEPGRVDIDRRTYVARLLDELFSQAIGDAIDWSSPGIDNLDVVIGWLRLFKEEDVIACLASVAERNHNNRLEPIKSWRYFESEILSIGKL